MKKLFRFADKFVGISIESVFFLWKKLSASRDIPFADLPSPRRILIIKLALMGDTVLLYPAVKAVKERFPESEIDVLCSPVNMEIVRDWEFIRGFILLNYGKLLFEPWQLIKLMSRLRERRYDLIIDFEEWFRITAIISFLTGAKSRAGFETEGQLRHLLYTLTVKHSRNKHEIDCYFDLLNILGIPVRDRSLSIKISKEAEKEAGDILEGNGVSAGKEYVIVHPGCGRGGFQRQWPEKKYAQLINYIHDRHGLPVIITGSSADRNYVENIIGHGAKNFINLASKTTIRQLAALVNGSKLLICGNTGVMHLASALDKKIVALHGPTDALRWGPPGKNSVVIKSKMKCSPCLYLGFEYKCSGRKCMEMISLDEVIKAVDSQISKR